MIEDPHVATRQLLVAELDAKRFSHPEYLSWFYDQNPRGNALLENIDDESGRRIGHYGVLPARFRHGNAVVPFIFSTNVATDSSIRKSGLFRKMANPMYERAAATGAPAMVGVGNDTSTVVVVDRFGWHRIGPMRARVAWGLPTRSVRRHRVTPDFLRSREFVELTAFLEGAPVEEWAQHWDTDFLRWRLSRPNGGYVLHAHADALAVSVCAAGPARLPFAVLLKVWPTSDAASPLRAGRIVASALRAHSAVACIYAGWNRNVKVAGVTIPHRLQPSPLNVVLKILNPDAVDAASFNLETFEFLDMDAY